MVPQEFDGELVLIGDLELRSPMGSRWGIKGTVQAKTELTRYYDKIAKMQGQKFNFTIRDDSGAI